MAGYFPILVKYEDSDDLVEVSCPEDIKKDKSFKIIKLLGPLSVSKCKCCGFVNEYIDLDDYVCYKCRNGF